MVSSMNQGNAIVIAALMPTITQLATAVWHHHTEKKLAKHTEIKVVETAKQTDLKVGEVHELVNGIAERLAKARAEGVIQGIAEEKARHEGKTP